MPWPPTPGPAVTAGLDFSAPATAPTGTAVVVGINFGATTTGPGPDQPITAFGRFAFSGTATANLDAGTHRGISQQIRLPHRAAASQPRHTAAPWQQPTAASLQAPQPWQAAAPARSHTAAVWQDTQRAGRHTATAWGQAPTAQRHAAAAWAQAIVQRLLRAAAWQAAQASGARTASPWRQAHYTRHTAPVPWAQAASQSIKSTGAYNTRATPSGPQLRTPWQVASASHTCQSGPATVRPAPVRPPIPGPIVTLHFCAPTRSGHPQAVAIVFGINPCVGLVPEAPLYTLPARYYMAVHTLTAQLLPSLAAIPIKDVTLSADAGSFGWTFSATGPASLFDALAPAAGLPARIRITLDGLAFEFLVDAVSTEHRFGQRSTRASGRSITALLARPYAREQAHLSTSAATAQQLAEKALEYTGVGLDWGLTDWLVPAGAWSHTATPLAAVQAIAEAAGGYIQSHRSAPTLLARHPYPELPGGLPGGPWNWSAPGVVPDVELAPDTLITTSTERRDGPTLNGVYVSGTTQGVLALVRRTGSSASQLAQMVTDPLITASAAAQQRGLAILGAAGPKHIVQINLPVLTGPAQPGVLDVGQLVQINHAQPWRGRVRSVSASAAFGQAVRQTITLERHLETT